MFSPEQWFSEDSVKSCTGHGVHLIPASRKKRSVILNWLVSKFEADRVYPEAEVNAIIEKIHPDFATLRRELIGANLMAREAGKYWRVADALSATSERV